MKAQFLNDPLFMTYLLISLGGFTGVVAYKHYFRKRHQVAQQEKPSNKLDMLMLNLLVGIPTAWMWFVMPFLPQPRFSSLWTMIDGTKSPDLFTTITLGVGAATFLLATYYLIKAEKANLSVTGSDYSTPGQLLTTGIYSMVRHPIVTFTTLLLMALNLVTGATYTIICLPVFFAICYQTALIEERYALEKFFGSSYQDYKNQVPGFFNLWLAGLMTLIAVLATLSIIQTLHL